MIASTSTLFLATLVFRAAFVIGAPIRISDTLSESVARAEIPTPMEPVARAIVDVEDNRRRSNLGNMNRRSARLVFERDEPFTITVREPIDITEHSDVVQRDEVQRRYPRRHLHEFYQKREPATSVKETTMVVTKTTVHDTPADAAAFGVGAAAAAAGASQPSASAVTITIPIPVIPNGLVKASTSTILSVSSATTILPVSGTSTATATSTGTSATDTASATSTGISSTGTATATSTDTSSAATATTTSTSSGTADNGIIGDITTATTTIAAGQTSATATAGAGGDTTATTGDKSGANNNNAATAGNSGAVTGGDQTATDDTKTSGVTVNGGSTDAASNNETRRSVKVSTSPIARRAVARSGASWASWARRQLSSEH